MGGFRPPGSDYIKDIETKMNRQASDMLLDPKAMKALDEMTKGINEPDTIFTRFKIPDRPIKPLPPGKPADVPVQEADTPVGKIQYVKILGKDPVEEGKPSFTHVNSIFDINWNKKVLGSMSGNVGGIKQRLDRRRKQLVSAYDSGYINAPQIKPYIDQLRNLTPDDINRWGWNQAKLEAAINGGIQPKNTDELNPAAYNAIRNIIGTENLVRFSGE